MKRLVFSLIGIMGTLTVIAQPDIDLSWYEKDFGKIYTGGNGVLQIDTIKVETLWVKNRGTAPLAVHNIIESAHFKVLSPAFPETVQAGDSIPVEIEFSSDTPIVTTETLWVYSDDPDTSEDTLLIQTSGKAVIYAYIVNNAPSTVPVDTFDFGSVVVGTQTNEDFWVRNHLTNDNDTCYVPVSGIWTASPFSITQPVGLFVPDGDVSHNMSNPDFFQQFWVYFSPTSAGEFISPVYVKVYEFDVKRDTVWDTLVFYVKGTGIAADFVAEPDSVNYGKIYYQDTASVVVSIINKGTDAGTIDSIRITDTTHFWCDFAPCTLQAGDTAEYTIYFAPKDANPHSANAVFFVSGDPEKDSLVVKLTGEGGKPVLSISPFSVDFGKVLVGDTVCTLTRWINSGNYPAVIYQVLNQSNLWFSNAPDTIAEGDTVFVPLFFLPDEEKSYIVTVVITYNGKKTGENIAVIGNGEGVLPHFIAPSTYDFGYARIATISEGVLQIINDGGYPLIIDSVKYYHPFWCSLSVPCTLQPSCTLNLPVYFSPDSAIQYIKPMIFFNNTQEGVDTVEMRGRGTRGILTVDKTYIDYGDVGARWSHGDRVTLKNTGEDTIWLSYEKVDSYNVWVMGLVPSVLAPQDSVVVPINMSPDTSHDSVEYRARVYWYADYGAGVDTLYTDLRGRVIYLWAIWKLAEDTVDLTNSLVAVGSEQQIFNTLKNVGWYRGWIDVSITGDYFSLYYAPQKVEGRSEDNIVVLFAPQDSGTFTTNVRIITEDTILYQDTALLKSDTLEYVVMARAGIGKLSLSDVTMTYRIWKPDTVKVLLKNDGNCRVIIDTVWSNGLLTIYYPDSILQNAHDYAKFIYNKQDTGWKVFKVFVKSDAYIKDTTAICSLYCIKPILSLAESYISENDTIKVWLFNKGNDTLFVIEDSIPPIIERLTSLPLKISAKDTGKIVYRITTVSDSLYRIVILTNIGEYATTLRFYPVTEGSNTPLVIIPSPSRFLQIMTKGNANYCLKIYDITGRKILEDKVTGKNFAEYPLPAGIYFVKLNTGKMEILKKVVIVK